MVSLTKEVAYSFIFLLGEGAAELLGAVRLRPAPAPPPARVGAVPAPTRLGAVPAPGPAPAAPAGGMTLRGRLTRSASTLYARAAAFSDV